MKKTHTNGELRLQDVGKQVVLEGWDAKCRNFGALVFIDLRDREGITQLVFDETMSDQITEVRNEYVLCAHGEVVERQDTIPNLRPVISRSRSLRSRSSIPRRRHRSSLPMRLMHWRIHA